MLFSGSRDWQGELPKPDLQAVEAAKLLHLGLAK